MGGNMDMLQALNTGMKAVLEQLMQTVAVGYAGQTGNNDIDGELDLPLQAVRRQKMPLA